MIKPNNLTPFRRFCVTIGELPTSYMESLSYYEMLNWLCEYIAKTVIPAVNNNSEAIIEIQEKYIELKNYVDNYFENLDVQEEINNKLDDMASDGTLTEIITTYLEMKSLLCFNNIEELKQSENLIEGSFVKTYGYYSYNDEGGAFYKIRTKNVDETPDDMFLIELSDNELIAELITNTLNVKQLGAKGDGINDDTAIIQTAINLLRENPAQDKYYNTLYFPKGVYLITDSLTFSHKRRCKIFGLATIIGDINKPIFALNDVMYCDFKDLFIQNDSNGSNAECVNIVNSYIFNFNIVNFRGGDKAINIVNANNCNFTQCGIRYARIGVYSLTEPNNICNNFIECTIENNTDYNVYLGYDRSIPNIFTFDKCYFEYDNYNMYVKYSTLVFIKNCYISCTTSGGTAFVLDSPAGNPFKMNVYVEESIITGNDDSPSYLVQSENSNCVGCINIDDKCSIKNNVTLYNTNLTNIGTLLNINPKELNIINAVSMIFDDDTLLYWNNSDGATYTINDGFSEGSQNSVDITAGYIYKPIYFKKGVTYKISTIAKNTGSGSAICAVFNTTFTTSYASGNTTSSSPAPIEFYFVPSSSGIYNVILRNALTTEASFSGLHVESYEPSKYNLI